MDVDRKGMEQVADDDTRIRFACEGGIDLALALALRASWIDSWKLHQVMVFFLGGSVIWRFHDV